MNADMIDLAELWIGCYALGWLAGFLIYSLRRFTELI
ncbi:sodium:proton antiporter [Novimethylophilus kurashikiensis]|uniref:Sodium:proton antiporter n=1 Tax=Novimethylophilus kurashikiensis TaxID=1825523 RepID=A0A2R5F6I1_9PROT|nr:sodium:proton antiporter [Novimethylophilus kurashikiensis]